MIDGSDLPLPTLLSQALVAFTIELDNEFERQMPHRTTGGGAAPGARDRPWLVSFVMWSNGLRLVGDEGVTVRALEAAARTKTNLAGLERWGYVVVAPDPADRRPKAPRAEWLVRVTPAGRKAQEIWRPLVGAIEERWRERFGGDAVRSLREALITVTERIDLALPEGLPILGHGLWSRAPGPEAPAPAPVDDVHAAHLPLPVLLSRVLLAFAIDFERDSSVSLAIAANVLRVLDETGVRVRDLPALGGVSKEAIAMAMGLLEKRGLAAIAAGEAGGLYRVARLTAKGRAARDEYRERLGRVEREWEVRFGRNAVRSLRQRLQRLVGDASAERSPLFGGLEAHRGGWRASIPRPRTLPHYPMVLHRGGFPDGS